MAAAAAPSGRGGVADAGRAPSIRDLARQARVEREALRARYGGPPLDDAAAESLLRDALSPASGHAASAAECTTSADASIRLGPSPSPSPFGAGAATGGGGGHADSRGGGGLPPRSCGATPQWRTDYERPGGSDGPAVGDHSHSAATIATPSRRPVSASAARSTAPSSAARGFGGTAVYRAGSRPTSTLSDANTAMVRLRIAQKAAEADGAAAAKLMTREDFNARVAAAELAIVEKYERQLVASAEREAAAVARANFLSAQCHSLRSLVAQRSARVLELQSLVESLTERYVGTPKERRLAVPVWDGDPIAKPPPPPGLAKWQRETAGGPRAAVGPATLEEVFAELDARATRAADAEAAAAEGASPAPAARAAPGASRRSPPGLTSPQGRHPPTLASRLQPR